MAKIQISEQSTKGKTIFLWFFERKFLRNAVSNIVKIPESSKSYGNFFANYNDWRGHNGTDSSAIVDQHLSHHSSMHTTIIIEHADHHALQPSLLHTLFIYKKRPLLPHLQLIRGGLTETYRKYPDKRVRIQTGSEQHIQQSLLLIRFPRWIRYSRKKVYGL